MTQIEKLTNELNAFNEKRAQEKKDSVLTDDFPAIKRTFTYRKSPAIKAHDIRI